MSQWITPEEIYKQKERKKVMLYISFPILAAIVGGLLTVVMNSL
ncbi:hypothetical protein ACOI1C_06685 [Bacillus sp. DJP31]